MIISFGKHAGKDIKDVPTDYLDWLLESNERTIREIKSELKRREEQAEAKGSWMERVVTEGLRAMAKKHHPDAGGSTADMQEVTRAAEVLKDFARRATAKGGI